MSRIVIKQEKVNKYPSKQCVYRPDKAFPEYLFSDDISSEKNEIYSMVREALFMMGLDREHYGTSDWNPLGEIITPGDNVLIKPNLVLDTNASGCGVDCLYTNPSLVAPIIDYVTIALKGKGRIVVGDAPLQECSFERLIEESGYKELIKYYRDRNIDITLVDFRNVKTIVRDNLHYKQENEMNHGVNVRIDDASAFAGLPMNRIKSLRITNYDPRILQEHHNETKHEYRISEYVLNADVIINMPKPKTHRKAGVTASLKNLVGINANKEYLPHHTLGSKNEGGDAYLQSNVYLSMANDVLDIKNELVHDNEMELAGIAQSLFSELLKKGKTICREKYWEGSWYGNDTIWRTIKDLNTILLYANKKGKLVDTVQRKMFIVGDMIVSGQKEGPLEPVPIYPGTIVLGTDPVWFDRIVSSLMGFPYMEIPSLCCYSKEDRYPISSESTCEIVSNNLKWNGQTCENIEKESSLEFQPTMGWINKLGNKYFDRIIETAHSKGVEEVYIFGAGASGVYAKDFLETRGIEVKAFIDNNTALQGKMVDFSVKCISPQDVPKGSSVIASVKDKYIDEIKKQINNMNCIYLGLINMG